MTAQFQNELDKIKEKCLHCQKCELCKTRHNIVFSGGIPNNKLMLIGEAPGYYEDMQGEPFVGKAGQLLDKIFASVGLSRQKDVYICNTLKCRPPDNRDPLPEEKEACKEGKKRKIHPHNLIPYHTLHQIEKRIHLRRRLHLPLHPHLHQSRMGKENRHNQREPQKRHRPGQHFILPFSHSDSSSF